MPRIRCLNSFYTSDFSSLLNRKNDIRKCQNGGTTHVHKKYAEGNKLKGRKKNEVEYKSIPEVLNINTKF